MVTEKTKKISKGIGKRIIESLRTQDTDSDFDESIDESIDENEENIEESSEYTAEETGEEEVVEEIEEEEVEEVKEIIPVRKPTVSKAKNPPPASDIDILLSLIAGLPSGVTKQTGALIIRQTMEALGISMNNMLLKAQSAQEELESNITSNVSIIEEYKNKIKILEHEIQKYRKKSHELEDIISLFILSDDKKGV